MYADYMRRKQERKQISSQLLKIIEYFRTATKEERDELLDFIQFHEVARAKREDRATLSALIGEQAPADYSEIRTRSIFLTELKD